MTAIIPKRLGPGSHIRVVAPSRSIRILSMETRQLAIDALTNAGFTVSFGKKIEEIDDFNSSSVESRVKDIHDAFSDTAVDGILTAIGGYNSNQILDYLDFDLIKASPKYFCGYSDVSVLNNAIYAKTSLITGNGPHFSSWAIKKGFEYSREYFEKCCMQDKEYSITPSTIWSDDTKWFLDQDNRNFIKTNGFEVINDGDADGTLIGGHVRAFSCLQGTQYFPSLENSILLLEEDEEISPPLFDRLLQSLIQQPGFSGVHAIVIGRFQNATKMSSDLLKKIILSKKELKNMPVIANMTIGHTMPIATFPIGGTAKVVARNGNVQFTILVH